MGMRIPIELVLTDAAMAVVREHDLNIPEIAITAIHNEIRVRIEMSEMIADLDPSRQNRNLRERLAEMQERLARLQGTDPTYARARGIPASR